jgi:serine protease AprX
MGRRTTSTRRRLLRVALTVALAASMFATTGGTASAGLLSGLGGLLGGVVNLVGGTTQLLGSTVNGLTSGLNLGNPLFPEFGDTTSTPVTLGQVADAIDADGLQRRGIDGRGVDVAVIDTGAVPVPGLDGDAVVGGPDLSFDRQSGISTGLDGYGHGTHLAGIIASRGDASHRGIAPGARILNMKVGSADGSVDVSQVIAAIDWVVQHRHDDGLNVRVINLAYGTDGVQAAQLDPLAHAVESAWRNGIVVVVAAGNSGAALTNPATDPFVLTVGGVDLGNPTSTRDDEVGTYSSVGTAQRRVDLVAPGTSIISLRDPGSTVDTAYPDARVGDRYFRGTGTSQAAAVTSGAVALLLDARPDLTPDQVKSVLVRSARRLSRSASSAQGAGMIDVAAATMTGVYGPELQSGARSTGLGTLEGARGSAHVSLEGTPLTGEMDVQGAVWNPREWAPRSAAGTAWDGGTWNHNTWAGVGWTTVGGGIDWTARTWRDATWTARTWRGDTWTARTWRDDGWTARTWRDDSWEGGS